MPVSQSDRPFIPSFVSASSVNGACPRSPEKAGRPRFLTPTSVSRSVDPRRRTDSSIGVKEENNNSPPAAAELDESRRPQFLTPQAPRRLKPAGNTPSSLRNAAPKIRPKSTGSPQGINVECGSPVSAKRKLVHVRPDAITVCLRVRPLLTREEPEMASSPEVFSAVDSTSVAVNNAGSYERLEHSYNFERVFDDSRNSSTKDRQQRLFDHLAKPQLDSFLKGYNCTVLTYGQTGSGKTFSMFGTKEELGIVPRFSRELFSEIGDNIKNDSARLEMAYFEIYQEQVHDLLDIKSKKTPTLKVREHPDTGPYVEGLTYRVLKTESDLEKWLEHGMVRRATATTGMNDQSSRSHAIFQLRLTQIESMVVDGKDRQYTKVSQANLVDLAGSERSVTAQEGASGSTQKKERYRETVAINKSLHMLKRVITVLAGVDPPSSSRKSAGVFVPFRDSSLTWLLKESLGGNSKTSLLITVSPVWSQKEETLSSLRFGSEARSVVTRAHVNEDQTSAILRRIKELEEENIRLLAQLGANAQKEEEEAKQETDEELCRLRIALTEQEEQMDKLSRSFERRMRESELARAEMEHWSLFPVSSMPKDRDCLVETYPDPMMTSSVCLLREPKTTMGTGDECDIWREGLHFPVHCWIEKQKGWTLYPVDKADVFVNGEKLQQKRKLTHLDHVCLEGERFFLCWMPESASTTSQGIKFELAKHSYSVMRLELLEKQWPRLKEESDREERANRAAFEEDLREQLREQNEKQQEVKRKLRETEEREAQLKRRVESSDKESRSLKDMERELNDLRARHKALMEEKLCGQEQETVTEEFKSSLIEELKKRSKEIDDSHPDTIDFSAPRRASMASDMFKVQRCNEILKDLGQDYMMFECTDSDGVRLTNTKQGISALLNRDTFHFRVEILKDLYLNGGKNEKLLEKVLFNRSDEWEKTAGRASDVYTAAIVNALKQTAKKRGSNVGAVRKSLAMFSSTNRRSTLSSILESSMTEEESEETGPLVGATGFWGPINGIVEGMAANFERSTSLGNVGIVELILAELASCRTACRDIKSLSCNVDERLHHALQATVMKLSMGVGNLNSLVKVLSLKQTTGVNQVSRFAGQESERWRKNELRAATTEMNSNLVHWVQNRWRTMGDLSEKTAEDLMKSLGRLGKVLGVYSFFENKSVILPDRDSTDVTEVHKEFSLGLVKGLEGALKFLFQEAKNTNTECWLSKFLNQIQPEMCDVLSWIECAMKKDATDTEFAQVVVVDLMQPWIHATLFLTDSHENRRSKIDLFNETLDELRTRISTDKKKVLNGFLPIRPDGSTEVLPSNWLSEKISIILGALNEATNDLVTDEQTSFFSNPVWYMSRRLVANPFRRRTSILAKEHLSRVDSTGFSDDIFNV